MKDDLISRQKNLPSADNDSLYKKLNEAHNEGYDIGYWAGRRDYEQKWIPCSERLPKKDGRYQVTWYDYVTNTEFIDILWYEKNLWWNWHSTGNYAVIAWMPLPEPYEAERKEE